VAHRLALTTVVATLVLILFGGLVTNTGAALAVPDWPTTFGYNMFLYPWSQMVGGVFYEHSHRLLGSLVGFLTLALAAALWREGGRLRVLGLMMVVVVITQGILGGMRVLLLKETLAIVHGCLAQAFFGLAVAVALLTSRSQRLPVQGFDPTLRMLTLVAVGVVYFQVVLGALITHAGWIVPHLAGAAAVFVFVPMVTARLRRTPDAIASPAASALVALLGLQLLLGVGSFLARFTPFWIPGGQTTMLVLPVTHRLLASLILGMAVLIAVRAATTSRPDPVRVVPRTRNLRLVRG
jgi:cytochrome c oxidase assembly protein subunit 15